MNLAQLHEDLLNHMPDKNKKFQYGDCDLEVYLMTKRALASGIDNFMVVNGMVYNGKVIPHSWIERHGKVIDPTASQFEREVEYSPDNEYREEFNPQEFVEYFEDMYGDILNSGSSN